MTPLVRSVGTGTSTGQSPAEAKRSRMWAAIIGLVVAVVLVAFGWNSLHSSQRTPAGDLPRSRVVHRTADGLHAVGAYLAEDATPGSFTGESRGAPLPGRPRTP
jgi:hypothetical protein